MRSRHPTGGMWDEACALLEEAERMHRRFFRLAASERVQPAWEPPVDVLEDDWEVVIVVALPGVSPERLEIAAEPGALVVRAERPVPFAGAPCAVRQLEIPYGLFERRIPLANVTLDGCTRQLADGCLTLRLRKVR